MITQRVPVPAGVDELRIYFTTGDSGRRPHISCVVAEDVDRIIVELPQAQEKARPFRIVDLRAVVAFAARSLQDWPCKTGHTDWSEVLEVDPDFAHTLRCFMAAGGSIIELTEKTLAFAIRQAVLDEEFADTFFEPLRRALLRKAYPWRLEQQRQVAARRAAAWPELQAGEEI